MLALALENAWHAGARGRQARRNQPGNSGRRREAPKLLIVGSNYDPLVLSDSVASPSSTQDTQGLLKTGGSNRTVAAIDDVGRGWVQISADLHALTSFLIYRASLFYSSSRFYQQARRKIAT
jgi:hypothetical protein